MSSRVFRFRVVNDFGDESQDWRIWSQKNDVYVGGRLTTNAYKASFHESGECHAGLTAALRSSLVGDPEWANKSRNFSSWNLDPTDAEHNMQHLIDILVPDSFLGPPRNALDPKINVLQGIPQTITAVSVFRCRLAAAATLKSEDSSVSELFRAVLPNGMSLFVIRCNLPETDEYRDEIQTQMKSHYSATPTPSGRTYGTRPDTIDINMRATIWNGNFPRKRWSDVSVQKLFEWQKDRKTIF